MGKVALIGAGPGDPALITYHGLRALQNADIIFYDRLLNPILLYLAPEDAKLVYVGKAPEHHAYTQSEIQEKLISATKKYDNVVRLKGGDPGIFGRVEEEVQALAKHGIEYAVYPGITSASGVSVYAGFAITERHVSEKVFLATPTAQLQEFAQEPLAKLSAGGTIILYMGMEKLAAVVKIMLTQGASENLPVTVVEWGSWGRQKKVVATLATIHETVEKAGLHNPALIFIGPVAAKAATKSWFEELPRFGQKTILVSEKKLTFDELLTYTDQGADLYPVFVGAAFDERFISLHQRLLLPLLKEEYEIIYQGKNAPALFQDFLKEIKGGQNGR
ncbi:uroporphyrinogen-III C-methyltransferase [Enterococcus montenegrensis]|uniref:uroporphyrinogen-III C-methyltransferase n=1 Tax=Enterococcus montenegrensis TaxID=3031993 RepID=UPI00249F782D|nr:uroporphyrinogen-III C-methyltransferase [Enterococcus montenegrensis]WHA08786.1 uroporphyrinogen-III C-methyltransferase [Enterococcus montenegrensis]